MDSPLVTALYFSQKAIGVWALLGRSNLNLLFRFLLDGLLIKLPTAINKFLRPLDQDLDVRNHKKGVREASSHACHTSVTHARDLKLTPRVHESPGNLGFHWLSWEMTGAFLTLVRGRAFQLIPPLVLTLCCLIHL